MTDLNYTIIDGDFPAGSKNKTATRYMASNEVTRNLTGVDELVARRRHRRGTGLEVAR